jgi:prepilin-type N-terminal cleavage/methylation domain-containing protein
MEVRAMHRRGFTLLEVMMVVAIMTIVVGTLTGLALGIGDTLGLKNIQANNADEARRLMQDSSRMLRQARRSSINTAALPAASISFRMPKDINGNGVAVDQGGNIELGPVLTISRDMTDVNGDGRTARQVVLREGALFRVLANDVSPNSENPGSDGILSAAEDTNGNGRLDTGLLFRSAGNGIEIIVQTQGITRRGRPITYELREIVVPRN